MFIFVVYPNMFLHGKFTNNLMATIKKLEQQ